MAYGLEIQNASGFIQIDGALSNFRVAYTGSASVNLAFNAITFPVALNGKILMVRPPVGIGLSLHNSSGAVGNFAMFNSAGTQVASSFSWAILEPVNAVTADSYGLQVFGPSGSCIFDNGNKYALIDGVYSFTRATNASFTLPGVPYGLRYVALNPFCMEQIVPQPTISAALYIYGTVVLNSETSVSYIRRSITGGQTAGWTMPTASFNLLSGYLNL